MFESDVFVFVDKFFTIRHQYNVKKPSYRSYRSVVVRNLVVVKALLCRESRIKSVKFSVEFSLV